MEEIKQYLVISVDAKMKGRTETDEESSVLIFDPSSVSCRSSILAAIEVAFCKIYIKWLFMCPFAAWQEKVTSKMYELFVLFN